MWTNICNFARGRENRFRVIFHHKTLKRGNFPKNLNFSYLSKINNEYICDLKHTQMRILFALTFEYLRSNQADR